MIKERYCCKSCKWAVKECGKYSVCGWISWTIN